MIIKIDGVYLTPLKKIQDNRGKLLHMLRNDDKVFKKFGEIYFSITNSNIIKGWYRHKKNTLNIAVLHGKYKFVLFDNRKNSMTYDNLIEFNLSLKNFSLLTIPPMIWYGFKSDGNQESIIANCTTLVHNAKEMDRLSINDNKIPYKWHQK